MKPKDLWNSIAEDKDISNELYFPDYPVPKGIVDYADRKLKEIIKKTKSPQDL